jgi:elongation factor 1-alpha
METSNKQHISLVISGHVDAGKSSLTGRLLFDLGGINDREMKKLQEEADRLGKSSFAFAFYMDNQKAERERGITIACNTKEFYSDNYHYTIIDAPGHRDFLKNFLSGSSQADVALLLVPADSGFISAVQKKSDTDVPGQTRQHARLLNLLGVKQLIVAVNKMDTCEGSTPYSEERFKEVAEEMKRVLIQSGWKKEQVEKEIPIIPTSGFHGENILKPSDKMPWWKGVSVKAGSKNENVTVVCLKDALDKMVNLPPRNFDAPLRMPLSQVLNIKGIGSVLTGRIEQGTLVPGDEVVFLPTHTASNPCTGKVFSIEMHHTQQEKAGPGDNIGINMKGLDKANMPSGGDMMIKKSDTTLKPCETFTCQVQVLDHPGQIKVGYSPIGYIRTAHAAIKLEKINWKVGKSTGMQKVENPEFLEQNESAEIVFRPTRPFVAETFDKCEGLARLAVMEGGAICMIGKIISVTFAEETTVAKKK